MAPPAVAEVRSSSGIHRRSSSWCRCSARSEDRQIQARAEPFDAVVISRCRNHSDGSRRVDRRPRARRWESPGECCCWCSRPSAGSDSRSRPAPSRWAGSRSTPRRSTRRIFRRAFQLGPVAFLNLGRPHAPTCHDDCRHPDLRAHCTLAGPLESAATGLERNPYQRQWKPRLAVQTQTIFASRPCVKPRQCRGR